MIVKKYCDSESGKWKDLSQAFPPEIRVVKEIFEKKANTILMELVENSFSAICLQKNSIETDGGGTQTFNKDQEYTFM